VGGAEQRSSHLSCGLDVIGRVVARPSVAVVAALPLVGCQPEIDRFDCKYDEPDYQATTGTFEVEYDGALGRTPEEIGRIYISSAQAESVRFEGCGYHGDRMWGVGGGVIVRANDTQPAALGSDPHGSSANAYLWTCSADNCLSDRKIAEFGNTVEGIVYEFDPAAGILRADFVLEPIGAAGGQMGVHADITWVSDYVP
jgi:hypothetical protein